MQAQAEQETPPRKTAGTYLKKAGKLYLNATVNVLAGLFNLAVIGGVGALYLSQDAEGPLDGLNKALSAEQVKFLKTNPQRTATSFYLSALPQKQFTFFGDTNHSESRIRAYFFGDENAENLIDSGIKHVFIEYPDNMQFLVDDLASGLMSREKFIETMSLNIRPLWWTSKQTDHYHGMMADMILKLSKNGVSFHFADPGLSNSSMSDESRNVLMDVTGVLIEELVKENPDLQAMQPLEMFITMQKFIYKKMLTDPEYKDRVAKAMTDLLEKRLGEDNVAIADKIRDIAGNDKAVILYGAAHILREHDLDEMLGGPDNTQIVNLYGTEQQYGDFLYNLVLSLLLTQKPDNIHILDKNDVYELHTPPPPNAV
ncbi:MAG: hypothetical protein H6867_05765 [Rhodospirillales bacterium]|nr:hypothetical protein [Rhodospirillales bacterium]MCB9995034.1 hypothetical protein [Rhodospirillales bacterium]